MYNEPKVNKFKRLDDITQEKSIAREERRKKGAKILNSLWQNDLYQKPSTFICRSNLQTPDFLLDYILKSHEKCLSENKVKENW